MNQSEFTSSGGGVSQADRILKHLQAHAGEWCAMTTLWAISGAFAVHSRTSDLRKRGHNIINRTEQVNGVKHSFYQLCQ